MKKTISVRLSISMHKRLQQLSREEGISLSSFIEQRLSRSEEESKIQAVIQQLDVVLEKVNQHKTAALHPVVLEFLKEIAVRLDSRIPSIIKTRLSQKGGHHE